MQIIQDIQDRFDVANRLKQQFAKIIPENDAEPNTEMVGKLRTKRFPRSDANHLSSAREYQKTTKKPVIFVSFDYKDIVNRKATIQQLIGLVCSDPIYGLDHLMRLQKK